MTDSPTSTSQSATPQGARFSDIYSENVDQLFSPIDTLEIIPVGDVAYVNVSGLNSGDDLEEAERDLFEAWIDTHQYAWNKSTTWKIDHMVIRHMDEAGGVVLYSYRLEKPWALRVVKGMENYNSFEFLASTTLHRPNSPSYIEEDQFLRNISSSRNMEVLSSDQFGPKYFIHIQTPDYKNEQYKTILENILNSYHHSGAKNHQNHIFGLDIIVHAPNGSAVRHQNLQYSFRELYANGKINHTVYRNALISDGIWLSDLPGDIEPGEVKREKPSTEPPVSASTTNRSVPQSPE